MRFLLTGLISLLLLGACGPKHAPQPAPAIPQALSDRAALYLSLQQAERDGDGFILTDSCDSLLFSALNGSVPGVGPIHIEAAQGDLGQWFRRPLSYAPCYSDSDPKSSDISRDMLIGLMVYADVWSRRDIVENLFAWGSAHLWEMGRDHTIGTALMTPDLIGVLAQTIEHLGGSHRAVEETPPLYNTTPGFISHLTLLEVLLYGRNHGSIRDLELSALRSIVAQEPQNPLAQALLHKYTDGDQSIALRLLQDTWPDNRLPNTADWCEEWRTQRADGDAGFKPCSSGPVRAHIGGDYLFVFAVLDGNI